MTPSHFQHADRIKEKETIKLLLNVYDQCFKNLKQSGFHDDEIPTDIVEMSSVTVVPFADFSNNSSIMMYMHQYVYQHPNILEKVLGRVSIGFYLYAI